MNFISFVIPCYNSQNTLAEVVHEIVHTIRALADYNYEIILVNDGSPDHTLDLIQNLVSQNSHIIGINFSKNFGQHAALMAGLRRAKGDVMICLDDDGQTPADEMAKLLEKIEEGYDVVYASYDHKKHSPFRNWGSFLNSKMTEIMLGKPKDLSVTSYFAARRYVIEEAIRYEQCYPYIIGLILRTTKNICNVPVHHRQRSEGNSGYSLAKLFSLWLNGFTSFSVKPLRIASYFGCISACCGFLYLIYIIANHFINRAAPLGWSSTMAILLILGGIILIVLGLIGEYVGRIYMCTNASPQYVIRDIIQNDSSTQS